MIVTQTRQISSCHDFELDVARTTKLHYDIAYPSEGKADAVVFIIAGFGEDTNSEYLQKLRRYAAETFNVVAVSVYYHCFYSRPNNGASLEFDDIDIAVLQDVIARYEVDFSAVQHITKEHVLEHLNAVFSARKKAQTMEESAQVMVPMTLVPHNGEYQNFGLMQAVDHMNVLLDIQRHFDVVCEKTTTIFLGSSHGGYIASLCAKIAPQLVDVVIDNSSYVTPNLQYIVGKERNINAPEYLVYHKHLRLHCFVQTLWTTNTQSPYCFSQDRYRIRDLSDTGHLHRHVEAAQGSIRYIAYHSTEDMLASPREKEQFYRNLQDLGFSATLHLVDNSMIDGRFIKTLEHGMQMSIKELMNRELPQVLNDAPRVIQRGREFCCQCDTLTYRFVVQDHALQSTCV